VICMASVAYEIKTEEAAPAEYSEIEAAKEYFAEEAANPIAKVAGTGSALVKNQNGEYGARFLPIGEEPEYFIKDQLKG